MSDDPDQIAPLAMALFGIRDHVRHHWGCADKRGIGGHHFDAADECALGDIVRRYGDERAKVTEAKLAAARLALAACREVREARDA